MTSVLKNVFSSLLKAEPTKQEFEAMMQEQINFDILCETSFLVLTSRHIICGIMNCISANIRNSL